MTTGRVPRFAEAKLARSAGAAISPHRGIANPAWDDVAATDPSGSFGGGPGLWEIETRDTFEIPISRVAPVQPEGSIEGQAAQQAENRSAAKNGAMLGSSLFFTASVGVLVSLFVVPNVVGDRDTGILGFGEALATVSLVLAGFGMDTYLRKEVALRRDHADRLFASVLAVRLFVSALLTAVAVGVLAFRQSDVGEDATSSNSLSRTLIVVLLFCMAQFSQQTAESYAAMLQAVGQVRQQSSLTIWTKTIWAVIIVVGLLLGMGIWVVPLALFVTESAKTLVLGISAQKVFHIEWKIYPREVWPMLKAGSPFLVTAISVKVIAWLDVAMVKLLTGDDAETGYYHIALRISALALLLAPLIQWVVLPMAARAAERSRQDFADLVKRSFQWVLCAGVPMSLLLGLNADVLIETALPDFTPSIPALRILSGVIALAYISMLGATLLIADGRSWRVVRITFLTIAVDAVMNLYMIKHGWMWWGQGTGALKAGGAGVGAAISLVTSECIAAALMGYELRRVVRRISDAEARRAVGAMFGACVLVIAVDHFARPLGIIRPLIDLLMMVAALTALGVIRLDWYRMLFARLGLRPAQPAATDLPNPTRQ